MRRTDTNEEGDIPAICHFLDVAINEHPEVTSRFIAQQIGTNESTVSRWRSGKTEPSREMVREIEKLLGKRPGYVERLAGFVEDPPGSKKLMDAVRESAEIDDTHREIILGIVKTAIAQTAKSRRGRN